MVNLELIAALPVDPILPPARNFEVWVDAERVQAQEKLQSHAGTVWSSKSYGKEGA